jgi:hypothetical protein
LSSNFENVSATSATNFSEICTFLLCWVNLVPLLKYRVGIEAEWLSDVCDSAMRPSCIKNSMQSSSKGGNASPNRTIQGRTAWNIQFECHWKEKCKKKEQITSGKA